MATNIMGTGTSALGANVVGTEWIEKVFVEALRAKLQTTILGKRSTMPENESKKVRWQFMSDPSGMPFTTSLTEGSDPASTSDFTTTTAEATLKEYGTYTAFSKFLAKSAISGTIEEFIKGAAYGAANTLDTISQLTLTAGLTATYAGTSFAADDLRLATQKLVSRNVLTHPMTPGFYAALLSAEAAYDMMGEGAPAWFQAKSALIEDNLLTPFQGSPASSALYGAIVKIQTNTSNSGGRTTVTSPDRDNNFVLGQDAFGVASLATDITGPAPIITMPDQLVSAPVRNRGTIGWWALFEAVLISTARAELITSDATGIGV